MQQATLPMFNMVWMIYLATVKLNCDCLYFILKGGNSEFWPLCLPSVASPGRNILRVTSVGPPALQSHLVIFLQYFQHLHVIIQY
jgi:hypothetical protein